MFALLDIFVVLSCFILQDPNILGAILSYLQWMQHKDNFIHKAALKLTSMQLFYKFFDIFVIYINLAKSVNKEESKCQLWKQKHSNDLEIK